MGHPLKLPALGALGVAAAAFGLHLGESAIAGINPIHFQGAAVHPRDRGAAVPDVPLAPVQSDFAMAYGWDQGANARAQDCPGCGVAGSSDAYSRSQAGYRSDVDIALAAPAPAPPVRTAARTFQEEQPQAFETQYASVDRYAHYDIEETAADDGAAEAPADGAEAAYDE
jgi:hypothetical protein